MRSESLNFRCEARERERACAVDYVEDSRKNLKRVEPIYSCFVDGVREYVDCFEENHECDGPADVCQKFDANACLITHTVDVEDGPDAPDDSLSGLQTIWECALPE